jgi:CHAT domain-containing protein
MTFFYSNLAEGMAQEKALQLAQVAMIRAAAPKRSWMQTLARIFDEESATDYSHPYRWAGFVLNGPGG